MKRILEKLLDKKDLDYDEMQQTMQLIMSGKVDDIQISAFLIAMRAKGESIDEIIAAAHVMHDLSKKIECDESSLVDIVGTGGDGQNTFNISTTSAFVAASAGVVIAKHGNRRSSSLCGSADVLERSGININLSRQQVKRCIKILNIGFMFAPLHHQAMAHVKLVRKTLQIRTIFNLLGPLTNPASARHQVIGLFDKKWLLPIAECFKALGSVHSLIVHSYDGLDELSVFDKNYVVELKNNQLTEFILDPNDYALGHQHLSDIQINSIDEGVEKMLSVLDGDSGAHRDIVILNAAAAIYSADIKSTWDEAILAATHAIDNGKALKLFNQLKKLSNEK